jgi:hypothetical protein
MTLRAHHGHGSFDIAEKIDQVIRVQHQIKEHHTFDVYVYDDCVIVAESG